jgi:hypothetical protein
LPPTETEVEMRSRRTRSSMRQLPRRSARKRRLATVTARGNASGLQRVLVALGPMQSSAWMPPMPQRSTTRTRAFAPGLTRRGASSEKRLAHDGVRTL